MGITLECCGIIPQKERTVEGIPHAAQRIGSQVLIEFCIHTFFPAPVGHIIIILDRLPQDLCELCGAPAVQMLAVVSVFLQIQSQFLDLPEIVEMFDAEFPGQVGDILRRAFSQVESMLIKKLVLSDNRHGHKQDFRIIFAAQFNCFFYIHTGAFRQSIGIALCFIKRLGDFHTSRDLGTVDHLLGLGERVLKSELLPAGVKRDQREKERLQIRVLRGQFPDHVDPVPVQIRHGIRDIVDILRIHRLLIVPGAAAVQNNE